VAVQPGRFRLEESDNRITDGRNGWRALATSTDSLDMPPAPGTLATDGFFPGGTESVLTPLRCLAALATATLIATPVAAQFTYASGGIHSANGISVPPDGGNQPASVTQGLGLVRVTIDYSSPHVHTAAGVDRRGKIFGPGNLVPYGMVNLIWGSCPPECPWRAGANENTVFTTSHDIQVQGERLPAGSYGLFLIPEPDEWTIIFSKNSTSWGSFYYDPQEDALRVKAKSRPSEYHEDLTYEFRDRHEDSATAVLRWEDLGLPFAIKVENGNELYVEKLRQELRSTGGFDWRGWDTAAQFCLTNKIHPEDALRWAKVAVDPNQGGQENFTTLSTLYLAEEANGHDADAKASLAKAIKEPNATALEFHVLGRQLIAMKKPQDAMDVFKANAKLHPKEWLPHFGLARGHAALGENTQAIAEAKIALPLMPEKDPNRKTVQDFIQNLQTGKPAN
jgi:hypothetical protein